MESKPPAHLSVLSAFSFYPNSHALVYSTTFISKMFFQHRSLLKVSIIISSRFEISSRIFSSLSDNSLISSSFLSILCKSFSISVWNGSKIHLANFFRSMITQITFVSSAKTFFIIFSTGTVEDYVS